MIECPFRVGIGTAVYVYGKKSKTFVDSGISLSPDYQIIPYLTAQGIDVSDIGQLVNTHGHFDHAGGNARLKQVTNCETAAHSNDVAWIENHDKHYQEFELKYSNYFPVPPEAKFSFDIASGTSTQVDRYLSDGDRIDLKDRSLEVIHTPGHTPGCICLFDEGNELLFTGDSIQGAGLISEQFRLSILPLYEHVESYRASLRTVLQLDFDTLLCAHTFEPNGKIALHGREAKRFVEESLEYVDRLERSVLESLKQAQSSMGLPEIARRTAGKMDISGVPSDDVYVVEAHLRDLQGQGLVSRNETDHTWLAT